MDSRYLQILDSTETEILRIYTYQLSSEYMGKESLTVEIDLPIQYDEAGIERAYPFSTQWHINYNNNVYYLNSLKPTGVKDNQKRTIHYTLVFDGKQNQLENVFVKSYGRVFTDKDEDGYADSNEIISDVLFGSANGFYGSLYDFVQFLRKNLEYTFGYITDKNGVNVKFSYASTNSILKEIYLPKFTVILKGVDYETGTTKGNIFIPSLDILTEKESVSVAYSKTKKQSIDTSNLSFFDTLRKMNEVFTFKKTIDGKEKSIGYSFKFTTIKTSPYLMTDQSTYDIFVITIGDLSEEIVDNEGNNIVFEYGGLKQNGGLLSITRTTDENKTPTRIYSVGSGDNLPINYFHIHEDRTQEVGRLDGVRIPSLPFLNNYFAQDENKEKLDKGKQYLVPNKKYPFIWDKYMYNTISYKELAYADFYEDNVIAGTSQSVIVCTNVTTADGGTYSIDGRNFQTMKSGYIYIDTSTNDGTYYAFYLDEVTGEVVSLGVWSNNSLSDGFSNGVPTIPKGFLEDGGSQDVANSEILVIVNGDNIPDPLDPNKIYYVIYKGTDGTDSYHGVFLKGIIDVDFFDTTEITFERCNPYPKYITFLPNLMPECYRAYVAGWYYGFLYAKLYGTSNKLLSEEYKIKSGYINATTLPVVGIYDKENVYIQNNNGFPLAFMPTFLDDEFVGYELLGVLVENGVNANLMMFDAGLKDFCFGVKKKGSEYDYSDCGKIWKPIDYYEDIERVKQYGIIEVRHDFSDIKPSIVGLYIKGLGRLDELVDTYIPCLDDQSDEKDKADSSKWGKYWEDTAFIEVDEYGKRWNTKVPNMPLPEISHYGMRELATNIDYESGDIKTFVSSLSDFNYTTYGINFNSRANKQMIISLSSDNIFQTERVLYKGEDKLTNEVLPIPLTYIMPRKIRVLLYDEQDTLLKKQILVKQNSVQISIKFTSTSSDTFVECTEPINVGAYLTDFFEAYFISYDEHLEDDSKNIEGVFFSNSVLSPLEVGEYKTFEKDAWKNTPLWGSDPTKKSGWKMYAYQELKKKHKCAINKLSDETFDLEYIRNYLEDGFSGSFDFATDIPNKSYRVELQDIKLYDAYHLGYNLVFSKADTIKNYSCWAWRRFFKTANGESNHQAWIGIVDKLQIRSEFKENFSDTPEFFVWVKDLKFNPNLPTFKGEETPMFVFSDGDLAGIDNKFALSDEHGDSWVEDTSKVIITDKDEDDTTQISVNSKYRATLRFVQNDYADNQSIFPLLPSANVRPKAGDLFIIENIRYPHCPYVYSAERKLYQAMKDFIDVNSRYTYSIVFDDFVRVKKGINYNQLKVGNLINVKNNSLITSETGEALYSHSFFIKSISIQRTENSLYDKYTLVLSNYRNNFSETFVPTSGMTVTPNGKNINGKYSSDTNNTIKAEVKKLKKSLSQIATNIGEIGDSANTPIQKEIDDLQQSDATIIEQIANNKKETTEQINIINEKIKEIDSEGGVYQDSIRVSSRDSLMCKSIQWTKAYMPMVKIIRESDGAEISATVKHEKDIVVIAWNDAFDGWIYLR